MFSCEFCEVFKNTYFAEQLRTAASASVMYNAYILLCEVRWEEEEEYKNYLRITPKCFDKLFGLVKDNIKKKYVRCKHTKTEAWSKNISYSLTSSFIFLIFSYVAIQNFDSMFFIQLI